MAGQPVYTVSQWNASLKGYYSLSVGSQLFEYQGASHAYSLSAPQSGVVRFELHDGDQHAWDASVPGDINERDELATRGTVANNGTPLHISYGFTLEPGAANTAGWMVLGQLHQDVQAGGPPPPPFAVMLSGEHMTIVARYTGADGKQVEKTLWTDPYAIDRGHQYQMDIKTVMDPSGAAGRVVVTRDGITLADYSGPIGDPTMKGVYWAEGIYRDGHATETAAADYANLSIQTGSAVTFPNKAAFIAAPVLGVSSAAGLPAARGVAGAAASTAGYLVHLTGTAASNSTVTVYDNKTVVGSGVADASGHVAVDVKLSGNGTHGLYSVATDATGRSGITSNALDVVVGTSASIVPQLDQLAKDTGLGAVVLTDSHILNAANSSDLSRFLHYGAVLSKVDGGVLLHVDEKMAGNGFDEQARTVAADGTVLAVQRYLAGRLVVDTTYSGADNVSRSYAADGSSAVSHWVGGKLQLVENYAANGARSSTQACYTDSGQSFTFFGANGAVTKTVLRAANGTRVEVAYGITGQSYVSQSMSFDAAGKTLALGRYDAKGELTFASDAVKGTTTTYTYGSAGQLVSYRMAQADNSYSVTTMAADGTSVAKTAHYTAKGVLTGQDMTNPASPAASPVVTAYAAVVAAEAKAPPLVEAAALDKSAVSITATAGAAGHVSIAGTGRIGSEVAIMDGATKVGEAVVDGSGHLSFTMDGVAAGTHAFHAVAGGGQAAVASADVVLVVDTAATSDQAGTVAVTPASPVGSVSAPVVTDPVAPTAPVPPTAPAAPVVPTAPMPARPAVVDYGSMAQLNAALKSGAGTLGETLLRFGQTMKSAGYDHQLQVFDATGNQVQLERTLNGTLVFDTMTHGTATVVTSFAADGSYTVAGQVAGGLAQIAQFDTHGHLASEQFRFADGTIQSQGFNVDTGALKSVNVINADKSQVAWTFGITGQSYVEQMSMHDAAGKGSYGARFDAAGHVTFVSDAAGNVTTFQYDANGSATGYRTANADGSYSVTTLAADHASVVNTGHFTAKGALLYNDLSAPAATALAAITAANVEAAHPAVAGSVAGTDRTDALTATAPSLLNGLGGNDVLVGSAGDDVLIGGPGSDVMTGGGGKDVFWFGPNDFGATGGAAGADRITDFADGDRIDLSTLAHAVANQGTLNFIGTADFSGVAGQVHSYMVGGDTFVSGDLDGDRTADFTIQLDGQHQLAATSFFL